MKKFIQNGKEIEIVDLLKSVTTLLNKAEGLIKGGVYHTLPGAMHNRISAMGVINVPYLVLLMQEVGLLRKWGGGGATVWQVLCVTFFDEMVTPQWLERSLASLDKHTETTAELRTLREQVTTGQVREHVETSPVGQKSIEEIAEMVVTIERLEASLAARDEQIARLERTLAERPAFDADAALAAAIKRARGQAA